MPDEVDGDAVRFEDVAPSVTRNTALDVQAVHWFSTYRVQHRVADRFRDRHAFLLGDAAHLHSPVGGQGMNTGLGDAANLAWKLAAVQGGRAAPAILDSYEAERIGFARRLVSTTDRMFQLVTDKGLVGKGWRKLVLAHALPLAFKLPVVPDKAFRTVSQIDIDFRDGPLSQGRAGGVQGGDRLPWVADGATDNHAPLGSLDWQVHVYGTPPTGLGDVVDAHGLTLHRFEWSEDAGAKGLSKDEIYLVRPDGYVATAGGSPAELDAYVRRWNLKSATPTP